MEEVRLQEVELTALRFTPEQIEKGLRHCTTQEQCDGCPLLAISKSEYCVQVLSEEALRYIEVLKYLNRTLAQRVEELEGGAQ